ncbi:MAG: flagellar biosynthetic protein FliR [Candidatus Eisenbacteria bacterium]|nr:flagellar biosynthetic protein FliR [Candidatus Eisenbacteria bacterium]
MDGLDKLIGQIPAFLLTGVRVTGLLYLNPVFGRRSVPAVHFIWMTLLLSFLLFPLARPEGITGTISLDLVPLMAKELAVGMLMGFTVLLFLESAKYAGRIAGVHIGFGMASVMDPVTGEQGTLVDQLQGMMVLILFLALGGHRMILVALGASFRLIPLGAACFPTNALDGMVRLFCQVIVLGVQIASPVLASVFLAEAAIGILSRSVPQMNIFTVGLPLRIVLGGLVLIATMPVFINLMRGAIQTIPAELQGLILQLAP